MVRKRNLQHHQHHLNDSDSRPKRRHHHVKHHHVPWFLYITLALLVGVVIGYVAYQWYLSSRVNTPLNVPKATASIKEDSSMLWGSYRPGVYFGLKTRKPDSLVAGLMWFKQNQPHGHFSIRHWCNQNDRLNKYGWLKHDGRNFGVHEVIDDDIRLDQSFIKADKHWTARISVSPMSPSVNASEVSLLFYLALNGSGRMQPEVVKKRLSSISGHTPDLGEFTVRFPSSEQSGVSGGDRMYHHLAVDSAHLDSLHDVVMKNLGMIKVKSSGRHVIAVVNRGAGGKGHEDRFLVHQVTGTPPFSLDVEYVAASGELSAAETIQGEQYQAALNKNLLQFDNKFQQTFPLEEKGFTAEQIVVAKAALSNMIGGIGYFYGSSIVQSKYTKDPVNYWPASLYTAVPSRSFFPRGFLWDEGFHNLLISRWDPDMSRDILAHWFDLINTEGWIPREQILDDESRSRVPGEFVVQHNQNANPPTLFLPLQSLLSDSAATPDHLFATNIYPRLRAWYSWFNTTQLGAVPGSYRWHGRDGKTTRELNPKTLTSGLDDFPRASHPSDEERHVDLRCWMALASRVMAQLARVVQRPAEAAEYQAACDYLSDNTLLDALHWSDAGHSYSDYGLHTNDVRLQRPKPPPRPMGQQQPPPPAQLEMVRVVGETPTYRYVDAYGYVSLFPFLVHILEPTSDKLSRILDDLTNADLLWTEFGLRSLARSSPLYKAKNTEHDPPYWRGQVWVNINYLAVRALHHYSTLPGPSRDKAQRIYTKLRANLVNNIIGNYQRTGYIWEQYDDVTGQGMGSHPFTGWSALFILMMAETY